MKASLLGDSEMPSHHLQKPSSVVDQYRKIDIEITAGHQSDLETLLVPNYTAEEHGTWALMIEKQEKALPNRASREFLEAPGALKLPHDRIPKLIDVSRILESTTGWKITRV